MFCTNCGCENSDSSNFCKRCGTRLEPLDTEETLKTTEPETVEETQTAEGFYKSDDRYIMDGDLAYKMYDDGILVRRGYDVVYSNNPNDYYVCKYTVIKSMDDLSEREQKMLNEILGE